MLNDDQSSVMISMNGGSAPPKVEIVPVSIAYEMNTADSLVNADFHGSQNPSGKSYLDEAFKIPLKNKHKNKNEDVENGDFSANIQNEFGICGWILTILSYILIFFTLPISACMCIKVVQEYERAVIFRLGRLLPGGAKGPGIFFIVPCIDTYRKVDLRVLSFEVPPQEILSKDSVTVAVDAVVYFRISNATISVTNVEDSSRSTKLLAQTTLRNILGTKTLAEMLSDREAISLQMQATLDEATEPWGVKVERVEVKDVRLPVQLQRAMAAEAEAAREARAKVIVAEGEQKASRALKEAAEVIAESPSALQLRYLQTLNSISAEKNSTIIFPFPIDLLSSFLCRTTSKSKPPVPSPNPPQRKVRACCLYKYPDWVQDILHAAGAVDPSATTTTTTTSAAPISVNAGGATSSASTRRESSVLSSSGAAPTGSYASSSFQSAIGNNPSGTVSTASARDSMFRPPFGESPCAASSSHCGGTRTLLREARDADSVMPNICWNGDAKATLNSNDFTKMIHENGFTSDSNSTIQNRITRISSISSGTSNTLLKKALTNCINTQQQQEKQQQQKQQKQQQQQQQQQQIIHISKIPIRQSRLKDNNSSDNFNYNSLRAKTVLLREYPRVRADENKVIIRDYEIPPDPKPFIQDKLLDTSEGIVECLSSMSTSLLTNAAWYRDANGCTGFLPTEWRSLPNVQNSAIKTKLNADLADKYENKGRRDTMSDILWKNTKFTEHDKQNYQQNVAELKRYKSALRNTINIDKSIPRPFDDGAESGASSASEISRHSQKSVTFSEKVTEIHSSMIDSNIRTTAEEEPKTNKNENDLSFSTSFNVKNKANTEMLVDNELETLLNTLKICDEKTKCRVNEDNSMKKPSNNETSEQISEDKEKMAAVPPRLPPRSPKNILTIKKSKSTRSVSPQKSQKIVRSASGYLEEDHSVVLNNDNPLSNNVTNTSFLTESYLKRPNKLDTSKRRLSRSLQDPQMSYYDNVTPVYQTNSSNQFPTAEKKNKNSSSENDGDGLSVHEINAPNSSGKFRKSFLTKHDRNKLHKESREKKMFTNNKINNKAAVLLRHVVAGEAVDVQRRDSMLDSDSHESIVSATSLRAESRVRRFFDY